MDINKLSIEQLVEYINLELKKNSNLSVNKLADKIGIKRSTLKSRLQKGEYSFNAELRMYEKSEVVVSIDDSMKPVIKNDDNEVKQVIKIGDDDMTFSHEIKSNLIELAKNYDKIMKMVNNDKNVTGGISIELPLETTDNFRTTVRVNNVVWENFKEFCIENKMFTQRDLLSMALIEYMKNHEK